jgi:hypothetical protein
MLANVVKAIPNLSLQEYVWFVIHFS